MLFLAGVCNADFPWKESQGNGNQPVAVRSTVRLLMTIGLLTFEFQSVQKVLMEVTEVELGLLQFLASVLGKGQFVQLGR